MVEGEISTADKVLLIKVLLIKALTFWLRRTRWDRQEDERKPDIHVGLGDRIERRRADEAGQIPQEWAPLLQKGFAQTLKWSASLIRETIPSRREKLSRGITP